MTTNWQTTKKYPAGIDVTMKDATVESVEFTAQDGTRVRVSSLYGMSVAVPAPPPTETKHRVSGTVLGVPVQEDYDDRYEADKRARTLAEQVRSDDVSVSVSDVEIPF